MEQLLLSVRKQGGVCFLERGFEARGDEKGGFVLERG
jgi:hypothetical protein